MASNGPKKIGPKKNITRQISLIETFLEKHYDSESYRENNPPLNLPEGCILYAGIYDKHTEIIFSCTTQVEIIRVLGRTKNHRSRANWYIGPSYYEITTCMQTQ